MATCDWCLREAPVQTIEEELWRFWGIISKEGPLEASLRNICETCRSRYEEFSAYIERCKSNESITTMVLAAGRFKDEPPEEQISKSDLDLTLDVPFRCPHCGKSFAQSKNLKSHLRIHTGERPFRCPHCDKSFTRSGTLKRHSYVHTNAKPFVCSHCDRAFSQSSNMKSHLRVHTGEKPFGCPHCGKFFAESSTLKKHLRIHTGERPFRCSRCGMTFSHRSAFNRHAQVHTDDVGVALIQR